MRTTDGVVVATIAHPDLLTTSTRCAEQARNGREEPNGRTADAEERRRELRKPEAIRLQLAGERPAAIARLLDVPESTVRDWLRVVLR